jgi:hypothetical protein
VQLDISVATRRSPCCAAARMPLTGYDQQSLSKWQLSCTRQQQQLEERTLAAGFANNTAVAICRWLLGARVACIRAALPTDVYGSYYTQVGWVCASNYRYLADVSVSKTAILCSVTLSIIQARQAMAPSPRHCATMKYW